MARIRSKIAEAPAERGLVLKRRCAAPRGVPINAKEAERQTFEAGRRSMQKGFPGTWGPLANNLARG